MAGIVQALLITRQMWFVGFGLEDDNFHRVVDAVRRATEGAVRKAEKRPRLGYATVLEPNPLAERLWQGEIEWIHMGQAAEPEKGVGSASSSDSSVSASRKEGARRFEIFLDRVSAHTVAARHLLDPKYAGVLGKEEKQLAASLRTLAGATDGVKALPAWERVKALLEELGGV